MATAYTSKVASGEITELRDFAMVLARGMGALIAMRDLPEDAEIPESFEPSPYHREKLEEARARHAELLAMSEADCALAADADYLEALEGRVRYIQGRDETRKRYVAMIEKVEAWQNAPEGLKDFALNQLNESIRFDAPVNGGPHQEVKKPTIKEWRKNAIALVERSIDYHAEAWEDEQIRTWGRNEWLAQLRASLDAYDAEVSA